MTDEERYKKYVEEHCKNCKNKSKFICDIRISTIDNITRTKCDYYERQD